MAWFPGPQPPATHRQAVLRTLDPHPPELRSDLDFRPPAVFSWMLRIHPRVWTAALKIHFGYTSAILGLYFGCTLPILRIHQGGIPPANTIHFCFTFAARRPCCPGNFFGGLSAEIIGTYSVAFRSADSFLNECSCWPPFPFCSSTYLKESVLRTIGFRAVRSYG